jgi:hypothetical protein
MSKMANSVYIVLGLCIAVHNGHAFQLKSDVISSAGARASSSGYVSEGTLSQLTASSPWLTSSGFQAVIGFWHPLAGGPGIEEHHENLVSSNYINCLYASSPNPCRDLIVLHYSIAQESRVMLEVYNTLGQRVASLVDEAQPAGVYKVTWGFGIDGLAAGVYFYRLETVDYTKVRKLVVVN